jgi:hypothetical protein
MNIDDRRAAERGSAMVLMLFAIVIILMIGGLGIHFGQGYADRREMQTIADLAVQAGAHEVVHQGYSVGDTGAGTVAETLFETTVQNYVQKDSDWTNFGPCPADPSASCVVGGTVACANGVTTCIIPAGDTRYPDGAFKVRLDKTINTPLWRAMRASARLFGQGNGFGMDHFTIHGEATARPQPQGIGIITLDQSRCKSFNMSRHASLHLQGAMLFVSSDCDDKAMYIGDQASLTLGAPAIVVGGTYVGPSATLISNQSGTATGKPASNPHCQNGEGQLLPPPGYNCEPLADLALNHQVHTESAPANVATSYVDGLKVQCGSASGAYDQDHLRFYPDPVTSATSMGQNNCDIPDNPPAGPKQAGQHALCSDPQNSVWMNNKGLNPKGLGYCGQVEPGGPSNHYVLCPGIYFGGIRIQGDKDHPVTVRLAKCDDPACTGNFACDGSNHEPIFVVAGGAIIVRNTNKVDAAATSPTRLLGSGVTIYQGKHPRGAYGRIHFDFNSDVELTPPTTGAYKSIAIFMDPDYKNQANIAARALSGIRGDIYGRQTRVAVTGPKRTGADFERVRASFVVGTLRFGGNVQDDGDPLAEDPEDQAIASDASVDDDPLLDPFQPGSDGKSGYKIVLGD